MNSKAAHTSAPPRASPPPLVLCVLHSGLSAIFPQIHCRWASSETAPDSNGIFRRNNQTTAKPFVGQQYQSPSSTRVVGGGLPASPCNFTRRHLLCHPFNTHGLSMMMVKGEERSSSGRRRGDEGGRVLNPRHNLAKSCIVCP